MKIIDLFNYTCAQNIKSIHTISDLQYQSTHEIFVNRLSYFTDDSGEKLIANEYEGLINNKEVYSLITFRIAWKTGVLNLAKRLEIGTKELKQLVLCSLDKFNK